LQRINEIFILKQSKHYAATLSALKKSSSMG
jgi:hypothetical protein